MTIYFKNGETLTIMGQEGERLKKKIAYAVEKGRLEYITLYQETGENIEPDPPRSRHSIHNTQKDERDNRYKKT